VNASQFRDLSEDELSLRLGELKETYMKLRFQHATAQLDNVTKLRSTRRAIARAMTVINERKAAAVKAAAQ
jgi:large subunit ribosomal protein L29